MSFGTQKRTRSDRVASVVVRLGHGARVYRQLRQRDVLLRCVLCVGVALLLWVVTGGWAKPLPFRSGHIPPRDIVCRSAFQIKDELQAETRYLPGAPLARAGRPLSASEIALLSAEHRTLEDGLPAWQQVSYGFATFGMYLGLLGLCLSYLYFHRPQVLEDFRLLGLLLGAVVVTVALSVFTARDAWRAESIPLVVFGMILAIVYERRLGILLCLVVSLMITVALGQTLAEFIILNAAVAGPVLLVNRIRSRSKLIYVGLFGAAVVFVTALGVGILAGQTFGAGLSTHLGPANSVGEFSQAVFLARLVSGAGWLGLCVVLAGFVMTGLLPFIERLFDIQTDISLLELGDAAHPLLQQLAQRAPGTYNHSINVASLAEPAAEAIGGHGLLVRVGAYFHDIGKMLKPDYFVENQCENGNQHEFLKPAMSTLVIIAHVKDGADLARQHHVPHSVIDFIEQHHGTTLVEYFYRQAERHSALTPDHDEVDESTYRYPGPKPQTKEAAVLMLADCSEGACRTLVEPTPSRIESVVHDLAMKRLLDGQFDDCGLTLKELHAIEDSLVKSLSAVYHGRIKYPDQQSA
jgi:putative nucleotidyltransferase with HDIG domain